MIYFDYSATTPIHPEVLETYTRCEREFFANANSSHALGIKAMKVIDEQLAIMANLLGIKPNELIITSSAVESNNTVLKGVALKYPNKKHIITSSIEHASIISAISFLDQQGYDIDFVELDENGRFDLQNLESLLREDTLLVTLIAVDSETGIRQPIEEVGKLCHKHHVLFHSDITQAVGKSTFDLTDVDYASFSAHKIYGPKGIAGLIKKENVGLSPLLHGGHSITAYRASTPQTALVCALSKALQIAYSTYDERLIKVNQLKDYLIQKTSHLNRVVINSNHYSIPFIVNLSILDTRPEEILQVFSNNELYLSSKSACSGQDEFSNSVYAITKDKQRAQSSYRISLSHLTSEEDIDSLVQVIERIIYEG
ncbi:MAG: cysteine desulfurase family protein [Erysipelotrichaceae bacterium]